MHTSDSEECPHCNTTNCLRYLLDLSTKNSPRLFHTSASKLAYNECWKRKLSDIEPVRYVNGKPEYEIDAYFIRKK